MFKNDDQNFDGRSNKFQQNIYGTTKGRLRLDLLKKALTKTLDSSKSLSVLDIGGGQGQIALWLAEQGHSVTLVDPSIEMLNQARESAHGQQLQLELINLSIQEFEPTKQYDLVLCHAVFEWLSNPKAAFVKLSQWVKPQGILSLMFFATEGRIFTNLVYGNFDYINDGFDAPQTVSLNPQGSTAIKDVEQWQHEFKMNTLFVHGIRSFADFMKPIDKQRVDYQQLLDMEWCYGQRQEYIAVARYHHRIMKKG